MLTIWKKQDSSAADSFCRLQMSETRENFRSEKVSVYVSDECPYPGYRVARVEIDPQVVDSPAGRYTVATRSFTYALLRTNLDTAGFKIIPISQKPHNLHEINDLLEFRVTSENFLRYLLFYGHVISNPPFYFFYRLDQLANWTAALPPDRQQKVFASTLAVFSDNGQGTLKIEPTVKTFPFLGKSFTFELPCFHEGRLHVAKCRLSEAGRAEMLEDRPLRVEEIFDTEENRDYCMLATSAALTQRLQEWVQRASKTQKRCLIVLQIDSLLQIWLLPLFLFHVFVIFALGLKTPEVFNYFERLRNSVLLTSGCLILGITGAAVATFRYLFLEILAFIKKRVPSIWSYTANAIEEQIEVTIKRQGFVPLLFGLALEHSLKILMSLTLFLYALGNIPLTGFSGMNFGQSLATIMANIPFFKPVASFLFKGTQFQPIALTGPYQAVVAAVTGFLFSTVVVGILTRIFLVARKES